MIFLEPWFWTFAAVALAAYWLCPSRAKAPCLLVASLVFHVHFAGPAGMAPIIVMAVLAWVLGIAIAAGANARWFTFGWMGLAAALAYYKYSAFLLDFLAEAISSVGVDGASRAFDGYAAPFAPLAISFFTFEFVHYLYEVRVAGRAPIRNPLHFAIFAIFFPTLAAGPVKRFPDFVPQLEALRNPALSEVLEGAGRVIRGLFKKVCVADVLVEVIAVIEDAPHFPAPLLVLLACLQGFRIYYDFCGYSDIAIGLSRMLGLRVPENFDRPYFATSLQAFWRRWHMSLTTWIRDYIYIPLGGNRRRRALNLLAAMALCGLWHGAAWNFIVWGIFHGLGLTLEAGVRGAFPRLFAPDRWLASLRWAFCYAWVSYGWLLFFYPLSKVVQMTRESIEWCFAL